MIDMLRLRTYISDVQYDSLFCFITSQMVEGSAHWQSFKWNDYRHNFKLLDSFGASYFVCIGHNMEKSVKNQSWKKVSLVIEYNPNKVTIGPLEEALLHLMVNNGLEVRSLDWAVDLDGVRTSELNIDSMKKAEYTTMGFRSTDPTYYFGKGNGRVKIYDKARELGLDASVNRTRVEVSLKVGLPVGELINYSPTLDPIEVYYPVGSGTLESLDPKARAMVFALKEGVVHFQELAKDTRKKYKMIIRSMSGEKVDLQLDKVGSALIEYIDLYLGFHKEGKYFV